MSNYNPYEPPVEAAGVTLDNEPHFDKPLATRGARLGAAIVDSIANMAVALPLQYALGMWDDFPNMDISFGEQAGHGAIGFVLWFAIQVYFLRQGQTVGKRLLGIRMVNYHDGQIAPLAGLVLKRYLPVTAASLIPFIGGMLALVDVLFIFGQERRCVHDLIAGTKVVVA